MKRNINNQQGAILIMSTFLIFVYIAFAALFVDGFRLFETKQEIDSYSQYITETLNKILNDEMVPYQECEQTCLDGDSEEYLQCLEENECSKDDEECITSCSNDCITKCREANPCYAPTFVFRGSVSGGQVVGDACGKTRPCCDIAHTVYSSITNNTSFYANKNYVIKNQGTNACSIVNCTSGRPGVRCDLQYSASVDDLIFAGIFSLTDSNSRYAKGSGNRINIRVVKKSCYDKELEESYVYPYYFE